MLVAEYAAVCNESVPDSLSLTLDPKTFGSNWTRSWSNETTHYKCNPEAVIGLEFSLIPEVESVFVDLVQKQKTVRVITVINERSSEARYKIYSKEQAIMDVFPALDFDFRILTRMNRELEEMMEPVGILAYRR